MTYAEYVAEHSSEWTNIMTNLGFYWADASAAVAEPDWANLDWATLTQNRVPRRGSAGYRLLCVFRRAGISPARLISLFRIQKEENPL